MPALYVANRDGSGARRLTLDGGGAYQGDAAWAPDGTRLVFTCGNFELCVTSSNGSGTARLTKSGWPDNWSYDFEPAWSPDGTQIVFSRKRGGQSSGLWLVGADGTGLRSWSTTQATRGLPSGRRTGFGSPTQEIRAPGTTWAAAVTASPAIAGGRLVIGNEDGVLYCIGGKD